LTYLALHAGKKLTREKLIGLLWSDRGEAQARLSGHFSHVVEPLTAVWLPRGPQIRGCRYRSRRTSIRITSGLSRL
jgi:hypothetical protein